MDPKKRKNKIFDLYESLDNLLITFPSNPETDPFLIELEEFKEEGSDPKIANQIKNNLLHRRIAGISILTTEMAREEPIFIEEFNELNNNQKMAKDVANLFLPGTIKKIIDEEIEPLLAQAQAHAVNKKYEEFIEAYALILQTKAPLLKLLNICNILLRMGQ